GGGDDRHRTERLPLERRGDRRQRARPHRGGAARPALRNRDGGRAERRRRPGRTYREGAPATHGAHALAEGLSPTRRPGTREAVVNGRITRLTGHTGGMRITEQRGTTGPQS